MENELLNKFLDRTLAYLNSTEAFLRENVPAFIEEMLMYEYYSSLLYISLSLFVTLVLGLLLIYCVKSDMSHENKEVAGPMSLAFFVVSLAVSLLSVPINVNKIIKIKVAPRVFLVEEVSKMVRR